MKKISTITERKPVIDSIQKYSSDPLAVDCIQKLLESFNNEFNSSNKRKFELLLEIIESNPGKNYEELMNKYLSCNSQYEKILIRKGEGADDRLRSKYSSRPKPPKNASILNIEHWTSRGFSMEEAQRKISSIQSSNSKKRHEKSTKESYRNIPHCIEFWINKGYSLEEAIARKCEYNSKHARSYENMIRKYGDPGREMLRQSQEKRKNTILERYESTSFPGFGPSKPSLSFFVPLYKKCRRMGISKKDIFWGIKGSREFAIHSNGKNYFYDFTIKSLNLSIEFNGVYWHGREDLEWRRKDITKEESILSDSTKKQAIENRGFKLFTIWEDDDMVASEEKVYQEIKKRFDERN